VDGPPRAYYTAFRVPVPARIGNTLTRECVREGMARLVGINHVALEVADIDDALTWYGRFFELQLRGRIGNGMAFIDMGDQFIALARDGSPHTDRARHFGLVVDDKAAVRQALEDAGVEVTRPPDLSFRDPWGNHVQVVDYREIQFTKTDRVLRGMDLELDKSASALAELRAKGLAD
jgi:catechol 2,3-dioxygenase-like lactoylglutathione lyase family enzyme